MAKSQSQSLKRLQPTSPSPSPSPSPALENDDLLAEFLLRLQPQPSTLPRVGLVCKHWRRVVADPQFVRRFRAFHRRTPPLHGFIIDLSSKFVPTQEAPDRLPAARFSWRRWRWAVHCCRHGLVLCFRAESDFASEFMVVDPMTGDRIPIGIIHHEGSVILTSTVLSVAVAGGSGSGTAAAGTDDRRRSSSFLVVALFAQLSTAAEPPKLTASVYSSESGAWARSVAAVFPPSPFYTTGVHHPSSLVGNAVYWILFDGQIVRFDLGTRRLAIIEQRPRPPADLQMLRIEFGCLSWILPPAGAAGGGDGRFCLAVLSRRSIEFWEREAELGDDNDAAKWVLCRTVQLDKVLPVQFEEEEDVHMQELGISGFDEESNSIFVWTNHGVFMSHVESMMQFKKVFGGEIKKRKVFGGPVPGCYIHPYSSF